MGVDLTIVRDETYFRDPYHANATWRVIGLSYERVWEFCKAQGWVDEDKQELQSKGVEFICNQLKLKKYSLTEHKLKSHFKTFIYSHPEQWVIPGAYIKRYYGKGSKALFE